MIYFTHNNGYVVNIWYSKELVPSHLVNEVIPIESVPEIIAVEQKTGYHFYNGSIVEVRYKDRPLTSEEEMQQMKTVQTLMQIAIDDLIMGGII